MKKKNQNRKRADEGRSLRDFFYIVSMLIMSHNSMLIDQSGPINISFVALSAHAAASFAILLIKSPKLQKFSYKQRSNFFLHNIISFFISTARNKQIKTLKH